MSPAIARTAGLIVAGSLAVCSEASTSASPSQQSTASAALKIVVVAGEDAVNIVQQKTAVAPIIEVRDRNDQPVAGAVVTFAIRGGRASFGGARTLAVTTDAAGRAVAGGVTPTASGAVQISATVEFQGQTTAVTITQTNVLTAAQAAAVSTGGAAAGGSAGAGGASSGGATAGGAGAGAGGSGGLSATTIGIIGGAAAGGAVVVTQVASGTSGEQSYAGPFAMDWVAGCLVERMSGTITVDFIATSETPDTVLTNGRLDLNNTTSVVVSRPPNCGVLSNGNWGMPGAPATGTLGAFRAQGQDTVAGQIAGTTFQRDYEFRGALTNGVVSGTFSMTWRSNLPPPFNQTSGTSSVTLNRVQ